MDSGEAQSESGYTMYIKNIKEGYLLSMDNGEGVSKRKKPLSKMVGIIWEQPLFYGVCIIWVE